MQTTYPIIMFDRHLIIEHQGLKVLVDTGNPATIGSMDSFEFMGEHHQCMKNIGGLEVKDVSELLGFNIDVLMGMDLIEQYYVMTDYQNKEITFSTDTIPFQPIDSQRLLRGAMGMVCLELNVKGQEVKLALDTGAKISYIDKSLTRGEKAVGEEDDFYPMIGHFKSPVYVMEAKVGNQTFPVNFGTLPTMLAMSLKLMDIEGAIGFDLFNAYKVVMDFKNNLMYLG